MRVVNLVLASAMATASLPATAQPQPSAQDEPAIVVTGSAEATKPAEWVDVSVLVRGDGDTQVAALSALAAAQSSVKQGIAALEGVTRVEVRTREARLIETFTPECERERDTDNRRPQDVCRPTGFNASAESLVRIRPASRVGAAFALAAERGAVSVRTQQSGVDDPAALRRAAVESAVRAARMQAEAAARAGGVVLGPLVRIVDPQARPYNDPNQEVDQLVVTGSRVRPAISLNLDPPPVREEARVTAVFRIGR